MALNAGNEIVNLNTGIVVKGTAVEGGYFVIDTKENIPDYACITGTLCYFTGKSKFYQYNGSDWEEANLVSKSGPISQLYLVSSEDPKEETKSNHTLYKNGSICYDVDVASPVFNIDFNVYADDDVGTVKINGNLEANSLKADSVNISSEMADDAGIQSVTVNSDNITLTEDSEGTTVILSRDSLKYIEDSEGPSFYIEANNPSSTGGGAVHIKNSDLTVDNAINIKDKRAIGDNLILRASYYEADSNVRLEANNKKVLVDGDIQAYIDDNSEVVDISNYYTRSEIDTKLADISSGGTIDLSGYVQLSPASSQSGNIKVSGTIGNNNVELTTNGISWYAGTTSIHGGNGTNEGFWIKSWSNSLRFSQLTTNNAVSATYKYTLPALNGTIALLDNSNQTGQITATSFYATSDKRLKENIKEFIPQKSILDLPVVEFNFKKSGEHTIGCLAQDLQEICPQIVNENDNGYLSINESKIIYLLLDEVKKLRKEVNFLKETSK